jgi:glycosyltransferase involved in cell wall biosynthesis
VWLLTFVRRAFCADAARNVVPTEWLAGELQLPRVQAIFHGMPFPRPASVPLRSDGPLHFLFVGRLVSAKGVELLLRAAEQLKEKGIAFRIHLVGDGPERAALEALAIQHGVSNNVIFHGSLPDAALDLVWEQCSVLIAPSLGGEVFGLVVADAMFRGRPIIIPADGALAEVAGEAGLSFSAGDVAGLTKCMQRFLDQPQLAAKLGRIAQERARRIFAEDTMVRRHALLYAEIAFAPRVS